MLIYDLKRERNVFVYVFCFVVEVVVVVFFFFRRASPSGRGEGGGELHILRKASRAVSWGWGNTDFSFLFPTMRSLVPG